MVKHPLTMRTRLLHAALAIIAGGRLFAQSFGAIQGRLLDESKDPLPFTDITAVQGEGRFHAQSDADGRFLLKPLPPGAYDVRVVAMNIDRTFEGVLVNPDNNTVMGDVVVKAAKEMEPVIVERGKWMPKLIDADNPSVMKLFHTDFKRNPDRKNPVQLISNNTPGVYKSPNGDGLYFRGSRSENMCYFVDGMKVGSSLSGVPNDAINSLSVYTGGLPAKYGDVTGGVVAIETKSYFDLYQQRNAGIQ